MSSAPLVLALCSALSYGTGDFLGGVGGRRATPAQMSVLVQVVGLVAAICAVLIAAGRSPSTAVLAWGAVSGVGSAVGNLCLYRGLATGAMNVVAPLSAVLTAAVPAIVGLAGGDTLAASGWTGLAIAFPATALVSLSPPPAESRDRTAHNTADADRGLDQAGAIRRWLSRMRSGVGWGLLAGCGFGLLFVALDKAGTKTGAWPLLPGQLVAVALVVTITMTDRRRSAALATPHAAWRRALPWGAASGLGGAGGNILFFAATGTGQLTVVAVITALYPAVTVLLAAATLHERTSRVQLLGLAAAAAAVALIAGG